MEMYANVGMDENIYEEGDCDLATTSCQVEVEVSATPSSDENLEDGEDVYDVVGDLRRSSAYKYSNTPTSTSG